MNGIAASEKIFRLLDSDLGNQEHFFKEELISYKDKLPKIEQCYFKFMEGKIKK